MVQNAITLFLRNGLLIARSKSNIEFPIQEKMLGFSHIENAVARIHRLIYNVYPDKVSIVTPNILGDDYPYEGVVIMATQVAYDYLQDRCRQNREYGI